MRRLAPLLFVLALLACRSGFTFGDGPGGLPTVPPGAAGTAQAMLETAQAGGEQAATALSAGATQAAPTAQALLTQAAGVAATAATAMAQVTPPELVSQDEAATAITTYAQEVLGLSVVVVRAGGLTADLERLIALSPEGEAALAAASGAAETYAALLQGGAGSVSYGTGSVSGDLNVELNTASLGAFTLDAGPVPATEAEALALALQTYPGLAGREFTAYTAARGFAWVSMGQVPGFDPANRSATLIAEEILLVVTPGLPGRSAVSAVVGKGTFAAGVVP